jgi:rhodanese-related sulfurtransferase
MNEITVHELGAGRGIPLIDVREAYEYEAGRVPGAVSLPLSELGARLGELPDGPFDVICEHGARSARAVEALTQRGYDATNVAGGTSAWREAGFEVEG